MKPEECSIIKRGYARVDLDAIISNITNMKNNIDPRAQMVLVIKTDGYGHGAGVIAKHTEHMDFIWGYATATPEEALELRRIGITKPVLILGYTFEYAYEDLIRYDIRPAVFREDTLEQLSQTAVRLDKKARIHIKVDTGMNRIGIKPDEEGIRFIQRAYELPGIEVEGLFTHFARADEKDKSYVNRQIDIFTDFSERVRKTTGKEIPFVHCSNSAAILELGRANMDLVRAGITLYGLLPSEEVDVSKVSLTPVMSLVSHISYIKKVCAGSQISYGGIYETDSERIIATVPLGYGDGYPRTLSDRGYVLIHGEKAPVRGRICMDQFMVDVTDIPDVREGDKVTLIGRDGSAVITMEELGDLSGRFNYELACDIGKRVPRVYTSEDSIVQIILDGKNIKW